MPPTPSFARLCTAGNITLPASRADKLAFLTDAGILLASSIAAAALSERAATLAWARHSLAEGTDPNSWASTLDESLLGRLFSLYPLPPAHSPGGVPSTDAERLAAVVTLYAPAVASPGSPLPVLVSPQPGQPIDKDRPPEPPGSSPNLPGAHAALQSSPPVPTLKRKMHEELSRLLPAVVYNALDATSHLSAEKRSKLLAACKSNDPAILLDGTNTAAFGHHFSLVLTEGDHFDAVRRGLALAAAGRSACLSSDSLGPGLDASRHSSIVQEFRDQWRKILLALPLESELSGTMVNQLWTAVTHVMTIRADRSATYGVPEVTADCRRQLAELPTYRAAIALTVARSSDYCDATPGPHPINVAYLHFFLPFWWEHVLQRPRLLDAAAVALEANKILKTLPALVPAAAPAPLPAAAPPPPPPAYCPPVASAYPAPPPYYPGPAYSPLSPPWPPTTLPPAPPPSKGSQQPPSCCKPLSPLIIGTTLGLTSIKPGRECACLISKAFPGRSHRGFECPLRLHTQFHICPGWSAAGQRIPTSWVGDDITPACRKEWASFAATLPTSWASGGIDVAF